jgi:TatD DNase family protein
MNNTIIDTHCHLQDFKAHAPEVWRRARQRGIRNCVIVGTNPNDAERAAQLADQLPGAYLAVGIHPVNAGKVGQSIHHLAKFNGHPKLVALGETGLDYFRRDNPPKSIQIGGLREHLAMAKSVQLPLIIHTRPKTNERDDVARIHDDLLEVLREEPSVICIIHCFSGGPREAMLLSEAGHYVSFAGSLTHASPLGNQLRQAAQCLPSSRLLVETDAPYVRPLGRSGRNEPAYVIDTLATLAQCRAVPVTDLAQVVLGNSERAFGYRLLPPGA